MKHPEVVRIPESPVLRSGCCKVVTQLAATSATFSFVAVFGTSVSSVSKKYPSAPPSVAAPRYRNRLGSPPPPADAHRASVECRGKPPWWRVSMFTEHVRFRRSCVFCGDILLSSRSAHSIVGPKPDPPNRTLISERSKVIACGSHADARL